MVMYKYNVMRLVNSETSTKTTNFVKIKLWIIITKQYFPIVHPRLQTVVVAYGIENMCDMG